MARMYRVTVRGTGQLNGPLKVDKTVEMEEQMAGKFNGGNRYEVIEAFVKTHYPGIRIDNIRNFAANVVLIKEEKKSSVKPSNKKKENSNDVTKILKSATISAATSVFNTISNEFKNEVGNDNGNQTDEEEIVKDEFVPQIDDKINEIISMDYSDDFRALVNDLEKISYCFNVYKYRLSSNKWIQSNNSSYDKLINKFEFGLHKLQRIDNKSIEYKYFHKKYRKLKFKRNIFKIINLLFNNNQNEN